MIQDCIQQCKLFFNNIHTFEEFLKIDEALFQHFESFMANFIHQSHFHSHYLSVCKSPLITLKRSYQRNYIYRKNNQTIYSTVSILLYYCDNCQHWHAQLPAFLIVPYVQYSMTFILEVLLMRYQKKWSVHKIVETYGISESTYYEWQRRYQTYYRIWITFYNRKTMFFFLELDSPCIIEELCSFPVHTGRTLFQYDRKLCDTS